MCTIRNVKSWHRAIGAYRYPTHCVNDVWVSIACRDDLLGDSTVFAINCCCCCWLAATSTAFSSVFEN